MGQSSESTTVPPHQSLRRELSWSVMAAAGVAIVSGALALAVSWKAGGERLRVHEAQLARARAEIAGNEPGRTERALEAVRAATMYSATAALRDVAAAALTAPDLVESDYFPVLEEASDAVSTSRSGRLFSRQLGADSLEVCELETGRRVHVIAGLGEEPHLAVTNDDDSMIAVRLASGALRVFALGADGSATETYRADHRRALTSRNSAVFVPGSSDLLLAADQSGCTVSLRRVSLQHQDDAPIATWRLESTPGALAVSTDGEHAAFAIDDGKVALARLPGRSGDGEFEQLRFIGGGSRATALAFRPQGGILGVACADGGAWLADLDTGGVTSWKAHRGYANGALFDPSGSWFVTTGWDGRTCVWEAQSGRALLESRRGLAETFSADGSQLVYYAGQRGFGRWQVRKGAGLAAVFAVPPGHRQEIDDIALSPDGRRLAAANREGFAIWDMVAVRREVWVPRHGCRGVAFSPGGESLLVTGIDGAAVWKPGDGLVPIEFESHPLAPSHRLASAGDIAVIGGSGCGWLLRWRGSDAEPFHRADNGIFAEETRLALDPTRDRIAASLWKGGGSLLWEGIGQPTEPLWVESRGGGVRFAPGGDLIMSSNAGYEFHPPPDWGRAGRRIPETSGSDAPGDAAFLNGSIALVSSRSEIAVLDSTDRTPLRRLTAPLNGQIYRLAADGEGSVLAAATDLGLVAVWRLNVLDRELAQLGLGPGKLPSTPRGGTFGAAPTWAFVSAIGALAAMLAALWLCLRQRDVLRRYEAARTSLVQAEKMRALGVISAGVAHDFRNLLSVISLNSGLLRQRVGQASLAESDSAEAAEEIDAIDHALREGSAVVRSLLGFAREPNALAAPDDPLASSDAAGEVETLIAMLGKRFLSGLRLHLQIDTDLPWVAIPAPALHQVLLNLVVNAAEAMNERGDLTITATRRDAQTEGTRLLPAAKGRLVCLSVTDSGPGIDPSEHHRIFEPFFTTKSQSSRAGTGLGLHTVLEISARHGVGLVVDAAVGGGATFSLELPVAEPARPGAEFPFPGGGSGDKS